MANYGIEFFLPSSISNHEFYSLSLKVDLFSHKLTSNSIPHVLNKILMDVLHYQTAFPYTYKRDREYEFLKEYSVNYLNLQARLL